MYQCVNCGAQVEELYRRYSLNVLKLLKCETCGSFADKYIEYDPVIILVDLMLLEKRAYRHLLYNCNLKAWWKLVIILWLVESFRHLSFCDSKKQYAQYWKSFEFNFDAQCNFYLILLKTAFALTTFVLVVFFLTKVKWYLHQNDAKKFSMIELIKVLVVGGSAKLLGLLDITWGHVFTTSHYFLLLGYTHLCLFTAYSVIVNNDKLESLVILGMGILTYNYVPNLMSTMFQVLGLV
ncbi:unnamed protein product [Xylocopa violacea]|uniref:Protein ARV n=1 Tax=Xylocopa violacea TaxID=135666 RepID=A0ABP1MWB3_XYLVO